jgi:tetratricopeptide (TPR) repeat protein
MSTKKMDERIEKYYKQELTSDERKQFETDVQRNRQLAEEFAFYLQTRQVMREELLTQRHADWQSLSQPAPTRRVRFLGYYSAAAMLLLAVGIGWYFFFYSRPLNPQEMAAAYVESTLSKLPTQLDASKDSLQMAVAFYNEGNFAEAEKWTESMLTRNPDNAEILKLAGLVALQTKKSDKAIGYFHHLAGQTDPYANPGTFYEAIAYLRRGKPTDNSTADSLLKVVIANDLEGKEVAQRWIQKE